MFKQITATKPSITDSKAIQQAKRRAAWSTMLQATAQRIASQKVYQPSQY